MFGNVFIWPLRSENNINKNLSMFDFRFKGYCFPSCLEWTGTEPEDGVMKSDETGINLHKHLSDIGLLSFFYTRDHTRGLSTENPISDTNSRKITDLKLRGGIGKSNNKMLLKFRNYCPSLNCSHACAFEVINKTSENWSEHFRLLMLSRDHWQNHMKKLLHARVLIIAFENAELDLSCRRQLQQPWPQAKSTTDKRWPNWRK